jgi:CDGSH-type Zn-finger protein
MADLNFRIEIVINGPYIVSGGVPLTVQRIVLDAAGECLRWQETKRFPDQPNYLLCRCGKSKDKPFCDSTHIEVKFDGTETAGYENYLDQCEKLAGPSLILTDAKALCAHAGFCDRAGGIWRLIQDSKNPQAGQIAIEEACNCPSGRLVVWDKEGQAMEPFLEPSIALVESSDGKFSGPIWVRGGIPIVSSTGRTYEIRNRVTLCGCGRSSNKPFCDGTHRQGYTLII